MSTPSVAPGPAGEVPAELARIVAVITGRDAAEVRPDRAFVADLRVDSLAMIEILEGAATRFGVRIEDEAVKGFVRVRDLVDYVQQRL